MRQTRIIMGMPITVEIVGAEKTDIFRKVFAYFTAVDERFSTYKPNSEISAFNRGKLERENFSFELKKVFALSEQTKKDTAGYFNIFQKGVYDPSGIVKGWAIKNAADLIKNEGFANFYIEAGGDIQASGKNSHEQKWRVGIRNPFNKKEIIKIVSIEDHGVATSGIYERGEHIYNPITGEKATEIVSLTVIGRDVYEADRFATAAFAMGKKGIVFVEKLAGFEGFLVDKNGIAILTSGFEKFVLKE